MPYKSKEAKNLYMKEWKKKNKDKVRNWSKKYEEENKKKLSEYRRKWEKENKEKRNEQAKRIELICEVCKEEYKGFRKSQRFCSRKCMGESFKRKDPKDYKRVWTPKHHSGQEKVPEHRLIMEKHLGRSLKKEEVVHHIDRNRRNNSIDNLILFPSNSAHMKHHAILRGLNGKK